MSDEKYMTADDVKWSDDINEWMVTDRWWTEDPVTTFYRRSVKGCHVLVEKREREDQPWTIVSSDRLSEEDNV